MDLCNINTINKILARHGFSFSKSLGQNFIIDSSVCPKMAELAELDKNTGVIEIGAGVGVLTKELCERAGKVVCVELDERLLPILDETLCDCKNLEIINADIMKTDLSQLIAEHLGEYKTIKVCANLPYYITSPIIMYLLENDADIDEIVVMVQKEAAERICAGAGTKQTGALSIAVDYRAEAEILFNVSKECFTPSPKVNSAVIKLTLRKEKMNIQNEKTFFRVVKSAFSQRRKTAVNSVSSQMAISKGDLAKIFEEENISATIRPEAMTMEEFEKVANRIEKLNG